MLMNNVTYDRLMLRHYTNTKPKRQVSVGEAITKCMACNCVCFDDTNCYCTVKSCIKYKGGGEYER